MHRNVRFRIGMCDCEKNQTSSEQDIHIVKLKVSQSNNHNLQTNTLSKCHTKSKIQKLFQ